MTVATQRPDGNGYVERASSGNGSSSLADVVELILDRGLVIDVFVRVSLVGIEILTIDARIVVASVDTFLRFAEATNRLDLYARGGKDLPELVEGVTNAGSKGKTAGAIDAAAGKVQNFLGKDEGKDEDEDSDEDGEPERAERAQRPRRRPRQRVRERE